MRHIAILIFSCISFLSLGQELLTTSNYPLSTIGLGSVVKAEDLLPENTDGTTYKVDRRFRLELLYNRNNHSDRIGATNWRLSLKLKNTQTNQEETLVIESTPAGQSSRYGSWADFKSNLVTDYQMQWTVTEYTVEKFSAGNWVAGSAVDLPVSDIHLEAQVLNDRIVALSTSEVPKLSITGGNTLNWSSVTGGVEYDVEWVFIDSYDQFAYSTAESPFKFKEPVRITTYKHSHVLDLIYPTGTLYFRVRPRGYLFRTNSDKEVYYYGAWSYAKKVGAGNMSLAVAANFEGKKNWQYVVAYAENGMSSSAVTYMDGTLRARQQLTKQKSTGTVVAAATLYDNEGRQSVQVIPTPISSNSLDYYNKLHRDAAGGEFDKDDFDYGVSNPMGTGAGAGRYYSSANDLTNDPFRSRVPDAEGYPYTQVIMSNDNLGRPVMSSGVGLTHRIGGGHETKYYYIKPTERELRELFGSNVGI